MFDAGAIQAHLDLETSLFDRKLTAAEARVKRFEDEGHKVKISAVFDNASLGRARQLFTQLDNQLSREAMQRLRSSPQGSVLGALNALFSPHPVTGGPSPQQSASSGLLGRIISAPGGGLPGGGGGGASILLGQAGGVARVKLDSSSVNDLANAIGNQVPDTPSGPDPGTASQTANVRRAAEAAERSAASSKDAAKASEAAARDSSNSSRSLLRGFGIGGGGGGGGGGGRGLSGFISGRAGPVTAGLAGGIGPGILGINAKTAGIIGLGGSALGAVPALLGGIAPLIPGLAGVGALAALFKGALSNVSPLTQLQSQIQNEQTAGLGATKTGAQQIAAQQAQLSQGLAGLPAAQRQMFTAISNIQNWWQNFTGSMAPVFGKALTEVSSILTQGPLSSAIQKFFTQSTTLIQPFLGGLSDIASKVLPLLGQGFALAAPEIRPLLDGLGNLVGGLLPGLNTLIKASMPAVLALAKIFGTLGSDVGQMFAILAPVLKQSSVLLAALFDVVGALFPIVGQLAAIFARALAPVFLQFAGVVRSLLPFLVTIGHVIASLAGAVLSDLLSAFGALAQILVGISPALNAFAKAFSQIFTVLENTGIFAIIGNAIESLVKPITMLINQLLRGLTPLLPPLISFISQLSSMLVNGLVQAVSVLLPPLTRLAITVLAAIAQILPIVLPLFLGLTKILTGAFVRVVTDLATAFAAILNAIPPSVLRVIVDSLLAIVAAVRLWAIAQAVLNILLDTNVVGLITLAIVALAVAITELAKHWHGTWGDIKNWALDAWHFLENIFHNHMVQDLLAVWTFGLVPLAEHWRQVMKDIQNWSNDTRNWFHQVFGTDMEGFFTRTIPGWFETAVGKIAQFWGHVEDVVKAPVKFVIDNVLDGLINVFDTITNAVGLGKPIPQVHPLGLASGGRIPGYGGGDSRLALLEPGEAVVDKVKANTPAFTAWAKIVGIPGYASGGKVGQSPPPPVNLHTGVASGGGSGNPLSGIISKFIDIGKMTLAFATGNATAFTNAFNDILGLGTNGATGLIGKILVSMPRTIIKDLVNWIMGKSAAAGDGGSIADYAMQWLGKVPYVWGGIAVPGGADCSGFVQTIYNHFGIDAPRTSEAQGLWVHRSPPVPGGLAFYHSPPGGPDPGHVAIVRSAQQVISQGGGLGPQLMPLHFLPLLFTGTPPGGLPKGGNAANTAGVLSSSAVASMWTSLGGPGWAAANMARIAFAESGDRPSAIQRGQPPGLTGWGLYQITPTSGINQNGAFGNLLNAANNTRAAISLFGNSGYQPWASDPVAAGLLGAGGRKGFASGGIIREPVIGFGKSGTMYTFAEREAEAITPLSRARSGAMIGTVFIQLPEGQTVAGALNDVNYWLNVARQQGWAGGMPGG